MTFHHSVIRVLLLVGAAVFLAGCNPATMGWSSLRGDDVSSTKLAVAKQSCGYHKARQRAVKLLDASGNREKNEQRAATLLNNAQRCMAKYGIQQRSRSAFGIGQMRLK